MKTAGWSTRGRTLLRALEAERETLLRGRFDKAAQGAAQIEAALEAFLGSPPTDEDAEREVRTLRAAALRNRRLLAAARRGVEETRRFLAKAQTAKESLGYDARGETVTAAATLRSRA